MKKKRMLYEADATQAEKADWQSLRERLETVQQDRQLALRIAREDGPLTLVEQKDLAEALEDYDLRERFLRGEMAAIEQAISDRKWPVLYPGR